MLPLSEKAKGKRRAESIDTTYKPPPPPPARRELAVRFTEGVEDLIVFVGENDSIRDIKKKVCTHRYYQVSRQ